MLTRKIKVEGKEYIYKGPNHPRIRDMLDILEDR
jgi:hypothetical protein